MPYRSSVERFGHTRGVLEGIAIGRGEHKEEVRQEITEEVKTEMVQGLLNEGIPHNIIMKVTGFPLQKLESMQKAMPT